MAFHSDFWVAVAAAAPVIGLANVVNLGQFLMAFAGVAPPDMPKDTAAWRTRAGLLGYALGACGILVQATAMVLAMISLDLGHSVVSPVLEIVLTAGGMLAALSQGALVVFV